MSSFFTSCKKLSFLPGRHVGHIHFTRVKRDKVLLVLGRPVMSYMFLQTVENLLKKRIDPSNYDMKILLLELDYVPL